MCRNDITGFNNILRALGTDVIEDKTNSHNFYKMDYRHKITIEKNSMLYKLIGKEELNVNSIHSMIAPVENVKGFAKITSYSEDGLVESFEVEDKKFVMGVKWHPELMLDEVFSHPLFAMFIDKSKNNNYKRSHL